jgi:hypothetical protein
MRLKTIGVAIVAVLAISALGATSASAVISSRWFVNGAQLAESKKAGENETTVVTRNADATTGLTLGAPGLKVALTATGVNCIGCHIYNRTEGGALLAKSNGKLEFVGVAVEEPTGCTVKNILTTEPLLDTVTMNAGNTYDLFEPAAAGGTFIKSKSKAAPSRVPSPSPAPSGVSPQPVRQVLPLQKQA